MSETEKPKTEKKKPVSTCKVIKEKILSAKERLAEKIKPPNNPDKLFRFTGLDGQEYKINLRQKYFSELYLQLDGNGKNAVIDAGYNVYTNRVAYVIASENLRKPNIIAYINLRLSEFGFDDENVGKQHLFLINQFSDLPAKAKGIDMYYKKKGEYAPDKTEHSFDQKITEALDRIAKALPK